MKSIGVRALKQNTGMLSKSAEDGELVVITNRSDIVSVAVPMDQHLLRLGVHIDLALKLFQEGAVTLVKAAQIAKLDTESFLERLAELEVVVVDQTSDELDADLKALADDMKAAGD